MAILRRKNSGARRVCSLFAGLWLAGTLSGCWRDALSDCTQHCAQVPERQQQALNMAPGDCDKQCYVANGRH